jgi:hypothetical protein
MKIDPEKQAEMDQSAAWLGDNLPNLWRRLYEECGRRGFSEDESMQLVKAYIVGQNPNGTNGT